MLIPCRRADCDRIFITSCFQENKKSGQPKVADNALMRFDFLESIIRISLAKYGYGQRTQSVSEVSFFPSITSVHVVTSLIT